MSEAQTFNIGYLKMSGAAGEEVFLSFAPALRCGPGIQRDGLTPPRMTDPHTVRVVMQETCKLDVETRDRLPEATDPFVQRAGTWTLFQHAWHFVREHGSDYRIVGIQSCGDLTMNPWHVALARTAKGSYFCRLDTVGDPESIRERVHERTYRCLVKWSSATRRPRHEFIDLKFHDNDDGTYAAEIVDTDWNDHGEKLGQQPVDRRDIMPHLEFALSGKQLIRQGHDIALANVIDQFQDVRHIFNLPEVPAYGAKGKVPVNKINFGEYVLFNDLNARRGALTSPILVDLEVPGLNVHVDWDTLDHYLKLKHFRPVPHSPTQRGEYRRYSDTQVEIFFPHNVYPFGVLGGSDETLVCLSAGGLSGRVGTTLEGSTRIMYDFFGCRDAIVLDEGYDTFHFVNPVVGGAHQLDNQDFLKQAASFTLWRARLDAEEYRRGATGYPLGDDMTAWPLNKAIFEALNEFCQANGVAPRPPQQLDIVAVEARRCQVRAVLIFAVKQPRPESPPRALG
jgi:hypothetical protein